MEQVKKFRELWALLVQFGFGRNRGLRVGGHNVRLSEDYGYDEYTVEHLYVLSEFPDKIFYDTRSWHDCTLSTPYESALASAMCIYDRLIELGLKSFDRNLF